VKTGFAWPEQKHKLVDPRQGNEGWFGIMVAKHCGRYWMSCRASFQPIAAIAGCAVYIKKDAVGRGLLVSRLSVQTVNSPGLPDFSGGVFSKGAV
jgi:hypothetical protein